MNKILLIIKREYLSRVKKKSFIIMTLVGPLLGAGLLIVPVWLALRAPEKQKVEVIDESMLYSGLIPEKEFIHFDYPPVTKDQAIAGLYETSYDAILYIPHNIISGGEAVTLYSKKQLSVVAEQYIHNTLSKMTYNAILAQNKVNLNVISDAENKSRINLFTKTIEETGAEKGTNTGLKAGIGFALAGLIYTFIFLYGVQIMRGVMEEKTSRIVEVILSSVKPFQLMMGKIIGVALVGLTQFILWVTLTVAIYTAVSGSVINKLEMQKVARQTEISKVGSDIDYQKMKKMDNLGVAVKIMDEFKVVDMVSIFACFLFYFLGGYLLYSALFAAVGAAVDAESDTQQFMLPITLPMVFAFVIASVVMQDPESKLAFWFSIIPLTSPVIMMVRLPFGVPPWEMALSMTFLILGFLFTTWLAGRIYRTGILMYGKKVTWKELGKWLFYRG